MDGGILSGHYFLELSKVTSTLAIVVIINFSG